MTALAQCHEHSFSDDPIRRAGHGKCVCDAGRAPPLVWAMGITAVIALASPSHGQSQNTPGYFGPIRFQQQVFTPIQRQQLNITNQSFTPLTIPTLPSTPLPRTPIVIPQMTFSPIPRQSFTFTNSIFGPIDGSQASTPAPQDRSPAPEYQGPYRSRTIRPLTR
ncbi:MAG: hypothetical protein KDA63_19730 [Planctomycetales bacterium]|nr:hypothetical protein [Planctomycetales bacterium]